MDSYDTAKAVRDGRTVYMSYYFEKYINLLKKKLVGVNIVVLEKTGDNIYEKQVPALEDEDFASKIEILFGDPYVLARYRHRLTGLKWFHTGRNGVDGLTKTFTKDELETPPRYTITKTKGQTNAPKITEYVIGQIIARERSLFDARDSQKERNWKMLNFSKSRDMSSLTIGILGVGNIGKHVAEACKFFGMTVWGLTRKPRTDGCHHVDVYRTDEGLADLLQNCDYICNILPSTNRTRGLLSGDILINCKIKNSVFINVGRGDVVDEDSLIKALRNGWIGGAVLDVFEKEPLSKSSVLWEQPDVIITPHISGWSLTDEFSEKIVDYFVANYYRYIKGEALQDEVDLVQGY